MSCSDLFATLNTADETAAARRGLCGGSALEPVWCQGKICSSTYFKSMTQLSPSRLQVMKPTSLELLTMDHVQGLSHNGCQIC